MAKATRNSHPNATEVGVYHPKMVSGSWMTCYRHHRSGKWHCGYCGVGLIEPRIGWRCKKCSARVTFLDD